MASSLRALLVSPLVSLLAACTGAVNPLPTESGDWAGQVELRSGTVPAPNGWTKVASFDGNQVELTASYFSRDSPDAQKVTEKVTRTISSEEAQRVLELIGQLDRSGSTEVPDGGCTVGFAATDPVEFSVASFYDDPNYARIMEVYAILVGEQDIALPEYAHACL